MIEKRTEERIKAAASIADVLTDQGVQLHRRGPNLLGLCPWHEDQSLGSFVVSESKNMCTCFSCNITRDAIDTLISLRWPNDQKKDAYPKALRYLAAMYNIYVDEEEVPTVERKEMRVPVLKKDIVMWTADLVRPFRQYEAKSPLLQYLRILPLTDTDKARLEKGIQNYCVGTYPNGAHEGWTIWWYIDQLGQVRTGKLMPYKTDGHRVKDVNSTWVHALLAKNGKFDMEKQAVDICLFGQHLTDAFPNAVIRIVESEKTALFCSAFCDQKEVLWMACGGLGMLNERKLETLMKKDRTIELWPDYDGYAKWEEKMRPTMEKYRKLTISPAVKELHTEADGEKADIMDIMLRKIFEKKSPLEQMIAYNPAVGELIEKLKLVED